jgi:hypothetical protein
MHTIPSMLGRATLALGAGVLWAVGCGGGANRGFDEQTVSPTEPAEAGGGGPSGGFVNAEAGAGEGGPTACVNLQCQQQTCAGAGGATTTVSGSVYDPAGKNALYDVVVYVPNEHLQALPNGASCDACDALYTGQPIVSTLTDSAGKFMLKNVPVGKDIPLVIQIGKWRRQLTIPNVAACVDNPQPDKSLRFPKNQSEGDIPTIAISTGNADSLECLLRRVGIDASEYGGGAAGAGRIHIFQGGSLLGGLLGGAAPNTAPAAPQSSSALWSNTAALMKYDVVLLSCEGGETQSMNQQALFDYAKSGGRVFASHFHYAWLDSGPFGAANLATWSPGTNNMGDVSANIVTTFPKGLALSQWLGNVGALTAGELPISGARHNSDVGATNAASQAWIKSDAKANPAGATEYFTFNTPLGALPDAQCGRVVFSDLHVGSLASDYAGAATQVVPSGCASTDLSPQEKALEFMLFDLSSCVTPDSLPPPPPPGGVK